MDNITQEILRRRMHGLYLSRRCTDLRQLSKELLGLHCWFHRNAAFSAILRGAPLSGWKNVLTKTWLYRGTLHGVVFEDLPLMLALHADDACAWILDQPRMEALAEQVVSLMEDGVYSRAEMRRIFLSEMDGDTMSRVFSPWGGIFVYLARRGRVAFRSMTSRDFDLIAAEPTMSADEALPLLLHRYFAAYGPATLSDAAWFFGLGNGGKARLSALPLEEYAQFSHGGETYYFVDDGANPGDIPELTLLSGFDPLVVSYTERSAVLPPEFKSQVILKSGICLPTIAVNGQIAGLWNIKKGEPIVEFFTDQPKRIQKAALDMADRVRLQTFGIL